MSLSSLTFRRKKGKKDKKEKEKERRRRKKELYPVAERKVISAKKRWADKRAWLP